MVPHIARVWINRVRLPILLVVSASLLFSILRLNLMLTYEIPPEFRGTAYRVCVPCLALGYFDVCTPLQ